MPQRDDTDPPLILDHTLEFQPLLNDSRTLDNSLVEDISQLSPNKTNDFVYWGILVDIFSELLTTPIRTTLTGSFATASATVAVTTGGSDVEPM